MTKAKNDKPKKLKEPKKVKPKKKREFDWPDFELIRDAAAAGRNINWIPSPTKQLRDKKP